MNHRLNKEIKERSLFSIQQIKISSNSKRKNRVNRTPKMSIDHLTKTQKRTT